MEITIFYSAVDGYRSRRTFKTLSGARKFSQKMVGQYPEIAGTRYAVSGDGIGKIMVEGVAFADLFPAPQNEPSLDADYDCGAPDPDAAYERYLETRYEGA